jgi:aldose 1-epimerase
MQVEQWGRTTRGERGLLFTIEGDGIRAKLANFGACVVALEVADRKGEMADVVLGFDTLEQYESPLNPYFGGIVGRVANRIANASFELEGRTIALEANEGRHQLHGGPRGFDRVIWDASPGQSHAAVTFRRRSPHGENGYPGNLDVSVHYAIGPGRTLTTVYDVASDALTPVNLTQHSYFNLRGSGTILEHLLEVRANRFVVVDRELIPTGELRSVEDSAFDFRAARAIGERGQDYDVCFALDGSWDSSLIQACRLSDPHSGRVLEIDAMQPGLQLYGGQHLTPLEIRGGRRISRYAGLCLEAQHFPDSVHHENFPSTLLAPGEHYRHVTRWRFLDA